MIPYFLQKLSEFSDDLESVRAALIELSSLAEVTDNVWLTDAITDHSLPLIISLIEDTDKPGSIANLRETVLLAQDTVEEGMTVDEMEEYNQDMQDMGLV